MAVRNEKQVPISNLPLSLTLLLAFLSTVSRVSGYCVFLHTVLLPIIVLSSMTSPFLPLTY